MRTLKHFTKQIFNGLKTMHSLGVSHRDLKPENILIVNQNVRICDVGSSKVLDQSSSRLNTPYVVSRYYRAPELILACNKYDFSIDIWSVGCIIFELLLKTAMFPGDAEGLQLLEMQQILGPPTDKELQFYQEHLLSDSVNDLFKRSCNLEKNDALSIFDLLRSSTAFLKTEFYKESDLQDAADLIGKCLKWVPSDRISAEEAMNHKFC